MSDLDVTLEEAITLVSQVQEERFIFLVALVLALYDTILSFPTELRCIWQRKLGTGAVLYLFIRYGTILNAFLSVSIASVLPKTVVM
ncbi:hypothetical protein QCA50_008224 [Cerrena zonata]|uniref:DUF6533 domain-containing protein n=1 Tax=Cerrena zonata TaxID=2478898 RepID=A0AAW0G5N1_9APHY